MDAHSKAKADGLTLKALDYRQPCPKCSPDRRKKKDPCLHVTVEQREVKAYCHHCEWGRIYSDDQERRETKNRPYHPSGLGRRSSRWW